MTDLLELLYVTPSVGEVDLSNLEFGTKFSDLGFKLLIATEIRVALRWNITRTRSTTFINRQLLLVALQLSREFVNTFFEVFLAGLRTDEGFTSGSEVYSTLVNAYSELLEIQVLLEGEVTNGVAFLIELRTQVLCLSFEHLNLALQSTPVVLA